MDMTIRDYQPSDFEGALAIWNSIIEKGTSFLYDKPFTPEAFQDLIDNQTAVICAEGGGELMGFYILQPNFPGRGSHIANASFAVNKQSRSMGVGTALANHSLQHARSLGFTAMQFNAVVATNTRAVLLWERLDFQRVAEIPKAFKNNQGGYDSLYIYYREL